MRGQAAMEYLFTYGWALFVVVIVLAILIGTGIFSSGWFTPNECVFQPDFTCNSFILYRTGADSKLEAELHNGLGFQIRIIEVGWKVTNLGEDGDHEGGFSPIPSSAVVPNGGTYPLDLTFVGGNQPPAGATKTIYLSIKYANCGANASYCKLPTPDSPPPGGERRLTGKLTTRVEQK